MKRIAVLGHYTTPNLGDEASAAAVIANLSELYPETEIVCITLRPEVAAKRYQKKAYPLRYLIPATTSAEQLASNTETQGDASRPQPGLKDWLKVQIKRFPSIAHWLRISIERLRLLKSLPATLKQEVSFLKSSKAILRDIDAICVAGSGTLQDLWGGPWGHPYTLFKWSWLAKQQGCRFYFFSCGTVPFTTKTGPFFIKHALNWANYVSVRDEDSKRLLESIGTQNTISVMPDVAHSHPDVKSKVKTLPEKLSTALRVGLNPTPVYGEEYNTPEGKKQYCHYIDVLTQFVAYLITENHTPVFYCNHPRDKAVLQDIQRQAKVDLEISLFDEIAALQDYIYTLDIAIASRFHGILFPLAQCIPTISISKDQKQVELMKNYQLSAYNLPLDGITLNALIHCFEQVCHNRMLINEHLKNYKQKYLKRLTQQYQSLS